MGKILSISGVDGCGKTTLANLLKKNLVKKGYRTKKIIVFRYIFLGIMIGVIRRLKPNKLLYSGERKVNNEASSIIGLAFLSLAIIDYWFHFLFFVVPLTLTNDFVICERYYYDLLLSARYHRLITEWQLIFFSHLVPKPSKIFYVNLDYTLLFERNLKEFSLDFYKEQSKAYGDLFANLSNICLYGKYRKHLLINKILKVLGVDRLNVLFLVSGVGPYNASGTFVIYDLIRNLSKHNIRATIITPVYKEVSKEWEKWVNSQETDSLKIISVGGPMFIKNIESIYHFISQFGMLLVLLKEVSKSRYEVIHEFTSAPLVSLRSIIIGHFVGARIYLTLSTYNSSIFGNVQFLKLFPKVRVIVTIKTLYENLRSYGFEKDRLSLISFGLEGDYHKFSRRLAKRKQGLPERNVTVVYTGPISKHKGSFQFLDMVDLLHNSFHDVEFVFIASRDQHFYSYKDLKSEILKRTMGIKNFHFFEGYIDRKILFGFTDILVLPQQDPHGTIMPVITLLDALMFGTSIVATDTPGIKDIVVNGKNGFLYQKDDLGEMVSEVRKLILSRRLRKGFECNAVISVKDYNIDNILEEYLKIYEIQH